MINLAVLLASIFIGAFLTWRLCQKLDQLLSLFAICYQIAGSCLLCPDQNKEKEIELLLNTLARPEGPGAFILLRKERGFQEVTDAALEAERLDSQTGVGVFRFWLSDVEPRAVLRCRLV